MIRDVDLVSYLPDFMKEYHEPVEALKSENPEFVLIWKAKDRVLYNRFIETADEYGISRYEAMLNLHPSAEDTLESRRSRVRSLWFNTIPYTLKTLIKKLIVMCGSRDDFSLTHNFDMEGYDLHLAVDLELFGQVEQLEQIIDTMIPCNIVTDVQNFFPCQSEGNIYSAGGIAHADEFLISPDFNEAPVASGSMNIANAFGNTVQVVITEDFQEQITVPSGSQNVAVGVTVTDIIST